MKIMGLSGQKCPPPPQKCLYGLRGINGGFKGIYRDLCGGLMELYVNRDYQS